MLESALAGSGESSANLGRMMPVVVDYAHAGGLAAELKTAIYAAEVIKPRADLVGGYVESGPNRNGGRCVQNVVQPGNVQCELSQILLLIRYAESAERNVLAWHGAGPCYVDQEVGAMRRPISDYAAMDPRQQAFQDWIVVAAHDHAVKRDALHELQERPPNVAHIAIAVHVLAIDVGYDRQNRGEF